MKREYIIQQAIEQARKSNLRCKHGAIIVKNNKIVSRGYNRYLYYYGDKVTSSIHAEVDAIRNCYPKSNLNGAVLYVIRVRFDGTTTISKPCKGCYNAISKTGLSGVYYSNRS